MKTSFLSLFLLSVGNMSPALAAGSAQGIDGASLGLAWTLPFIGILLSLSLMPVTIPSFWHAHCGKISALWAFLTLFCLLYSKGLSVTLYQISETYLNDFIPFILMIGTLYVLSGSLHIEVFVKGTPRNNTLLLMGASLIASFVGTTGAAMLFIRPLLKMNKIRHHKTHTVIFFIFLVCNIGGSLSALGDPPLFLGFLNGVPFFWPTVHLFLPFCVLWLPLVLLYYGIDCFKVRLESTEVQALLTHRCRKKVDLAGKEQIFLFILAVCVILWSGFSNSGISLELFHVSLKLEDITRDILLGFIMVVSFFWGDPHNRKLNGFTWGPLEEVTALFSGIFVTAAPVMAILQAGERGALKGLVASVSEDGEPLNRLYFLLSGALSGFLDNAPTYLAFFNLAGGNATELTGPLEKTLMAISCGSVFMGALTYIGNAPNFMVKAIAEHKGIQMPHFFGYMGWSLACLMPLLIFLTISFF